MTYAELLELLKKMTHAQLADTVQVYSGDIDETIRVIGTSANTDEDMGESLIEFNTSQLFLILE